MPKVAKAAVLIEQKKDLEIREYELPTVESGCILVKITCCTICGSDVHTWLGRRSGPVPCILGHEIVGKIVEMGAGVTHDSGDRPVNVGDRITWTIMDNCAKCYYCREKDLMMKCRTLKKYGHDSCEQAPHFVGGFAEYCYITPGTCIIKIPDNLDDELAVPSNCALSTVIAGWEAINIKPFDNVLIFGAGALGIYAAALASHYGCNKIIVTDVLDHRLQFIKDFGATNLINTRGLSEEDVIQMVLEITDGKGADGAMEVAGVPDLIPIGLKCLRKGGRFVEIGNSFPGATFKYDACDIIWRRLTLTGVHNYDTKHLQAAIDFLSMTQKEFPFHKIITNRFSLNEINRAMRTANSGTAIRVAVLP